MHTNSICYGLGTWESCRSEDQGFEAEDSGIHEGFSENLPRSTPASADRDGTSRGSNTISDSREHSVSSMVREIALKTNQPQFPVAKQSSRCILLVQHSRSIWLLFVSVLPEGCWTMVPTTINV